ncbi:MAG: hypothetical protein IGR76_07940 [Synechococcales cyanobacterium T60_A2020_003]|nr:hypothetical protein [Synechococcales cyanobacterium T60_A2020_003]
MKKISTFNSKDRLSPLTPRQGTWLNWSYAAIALGSALSQLTTTPPVAAQSTSDTPTPFDTSVKAIGDSKAFNDIGSDPEISDQDTPQRQAVEVSTDSFSTDPALSLSLSPLKASSSKDSSEKDSISREPIESFNESISPSKSTPDPIEQPAQPSWKGDRTPQESDSFLPPQTAHQLNQLFAGGTDSLVAKAVGAAEGTRTPEGAKTWAYYGHTDPGNGVFNLGTFSYQHGAASPEEADQKQLLRLNDQARQIQQDAANRGLTLGIEEQLNAIDLANQAPKAALSYGGYLDRLQEAYQMGLRGSEAILWARVRSYIDPNTQTWNAPGLGNDAAKIEADQRRRMDAIARAIIASQASTPLDSYSFNPAPEPKPQPAPSPPALQLSNPYPWFPNALGLT